MGISVSPKTTGSGDRPPLPRGVIPFQPKQYNDVAEATFGPLDKYLPANDNSPVANVMNSPLNGGQIATAVPHGQYIGLTRPQSQDGGRNGDFMQTYTGRKFWPMDPRADEVFIEDIAHSLAMQCRYAGHCHRFLSVAEHSVLMARHLRWEGVDVALWALLHDASEAYLVDIPRPVKPYLSGYKEAEAKVMAVVAERFGLAAEMPALVHDADNRIIADELANMTPMDWQARYAGQELGVQLRYWSPARASEEFMATFTALMDCRARGME